MATHNYTERLKLLKNQIDASLKYIESVQFLNSDLYAEFVAENDLKSLLSYHSEKLKYNKQNDRQIDDKMILERTHGSEDHPVTWIIQLGAKDVLFSRVTNGRIDEGYAPVNRQKANVYASAILNDLEPPRCLQMSDRPTGQTQSE